MQNDLTPLAEELLRSVRKQPGIHDAAEFLPAITQLCEQGLIRPVENRFGHVVWHPVKGQL